VKECSEEAVTGFKISFIAYLTTTKEEHEAMQILLNNKTLK
jgi:hypothetical protein